MVLQAERLKEVTDMLGIDDATGSASLMLEEAAG